MEIKTRNVNTAISEALWKLKVCGVREDTRNGPVVAFPEPVITTYERPEERVLFWGARDANPVFHLMESIWMLAGRRDVAFPQLFNSRIGQYSDDGETFNAAYGYRWRHHFGADQLVTIIETLKKDPKTRQAVMQIWEPSDLFKTTKDKACNLSVLFDTRQGKLNMTVLNRSNDLWYGCYGANVVHFSFMMEFVARAVGVPVGAYRQFSNNLHLYDKSMYDAEKHLDIPPDPYDYDAYQHGVKTTPILAEGVSWQSWLYDAEDYCNSPFNPSVSRHAFFNQVAYPMAMVSKTRKDKSGTGEAWAKLIQAEDWKIATLDWIHRRESAKINNATQEAAKAK